MFLVLQRMFQVGEATVGALAIDGTITAFALEDMFRPQKVYGKTRIPSGTYELRLRKAGSMHARYAARWTWHRHGMLWLQDVPEFEWIYLHCGNNIEHTLGCVLVGGGAELMRGSAELRRSEDAYHMLYLRASAALLDNEHVQLTVRDEQHKLAA